MARIRQVEHKNLKEIYKKRRRCVLKKARELSILCGIQVLLICISQAGEVHTWPEDAEEVLDAITRYRGHSQVDRGKHKDDLISYLLKQTSKRGPNRQILAYLAQRAASKLDAIRIRIRNLTNMGNASESNRDEKFEEVENITNPPQSSEPYGYAIPPYGYAIPYLLAPPAGPSSDPKNVNNAAALAFQQPPFLLWPQVPATCLRSSPERMTLGLRLCGACVLVLGASPSNKAKTGCQNPAHIIRRKFIVLL